MSRHEAPRPTAAPAPAPQPAADGRAAWRRLLRFGKPRATTANALVTVLALLLGFAIAAQVHQTQTQGLQSLREGDLVGILDTVNQDGQRLEQEIRTLQATR